MAFITKNTKCSTGMTPDVLMMPQSWIKIYYRTIEPNSLPTIYRVIIIIIMFIKQSWQNAATIT